MDGLVQLSERRMLWRNADVATRTYDAESLRRVSVRRARAQRRLRAAPGERLCTGRLVELVGLLVL